MPSQAATVSEYIAELPDDRKVAIEAIRKVFKDNLDKRFKECMQYGMIGYAVPHSIYPAGYHCDPKQPLPFAGIASQKNHIGIYLFCIYTDEKQRVSFENAWKKTGKKLDMGKGCIRCKNLEGVALDALAGLLRGVTVESFVATYEKNVKAGGSKRASKSAGKKKVATKKAAGTNAAKRKTPANRKATGRASKSK